VFLRLTDEAPFRCKDCEHRFIRYQKPKQPLVAETQRRKQRLYLIIAILLSIGVAIAVADWTNQRSPQQTTTE
jgi:hypothetical protein